MSTIPSQQSPWAWNMEWGGRRSVCLHVQEDLLGEKQPGLPDNIAGPLQASLRIVFPYLGVDQVRAGAHSLSVVHHQQAIQSCKVTDEDPWWGLSSMIPKGVWALAPPQPLQSGTQPLPEMWEGLDQLYIVFKKLVLLFLKKRKAKWRRKGCKQKII